jgi:hypothetical protein
LRDWSPRGFHPDLLEVPRFTQTQVEHTVAINDMLAGTDFRMLGFVRKASRTAKA